MKVYVVTDGGFDNCGNIAVTTNKTLAEKFIKLVQDNNLIPEINTFISEYDTNDLPDIINLIEEGYVQWHVRIDCNRKTEVSKVRKIKLIGNIFKSFDAYDSGLVWAKTAKEATELIIEYYEYTNKE